MTNDIPCELTDGLDAAALQSVVQWWNSLSPQQANAVRQVLSSPECQLHLSHANDINADDAVDFFGDDWESYWARNWESDWREYLTEHPNVRLLTLDAMCYTIKYRR